MLGEYRREEIRSDAKTLATIAILFPLAWLVPDYGWPGLYRLYTRLTAWRGHSQVGLSRGDPGYDEAFGAVQQRRIYALEGRSQYLREYRPGGWPASITVDGLSHVEEPQSRGQGVILWVAKQQFASLVVKKGLCQAGLALHHLSAPTHGLSRSKPGIKYLNPIVTRVEDRYLVERIPYHEDRSTKAVATMRRRLRSGRVLSITAGVGRRSTVPVPVLDGKFSFPVSLGPLKLARRTGAVLLPCFITRTRDGGFTVHITPPLDLDSDDDPVMAAANALRELGARLTPAIAAQPLLWSLPDAGADGTAPDHSSV